MLSRWRARRRAQVQQQEQADGAASKASDVGLLSAEAEKTHLTDFEATSRKRRRVVPPPVTDTETCVTNAAQSQLSQSPAAIVCAKAKDSGGPCSTPAGGGHEVPTHLAAFQSKRRHTCPICLGGLQTCTEGVGELDCGHKFCLDCVQQWTRLNPSCPLCKGPAEKIYVRRTLTSEVVTHTVVIEHAPPEGPSSSENLDADANVEVAMAAEALAAGMDPDACVVCGGSDRPDRILLCDNCQSGFHLWCLTPPLYDVPTTDEWFCLACSVVVNFEPELTVDGYELDGFVVDD